MATRRVRHLLVPLVGILGLCTGDLPVHCPHHTQVGTWKFSMSSPTQDKTLKCAHASGQDMCFYGSCFTNNNIGPPAFSEDFTWTVSLADPNIAVATNEKGEKLKGTWTSVYDEGFEVDVSGRKFFAFSHFDDSGSQCDRTHPGWHRDAANPDAKKWGCYTAHKQSGELHEEHVAMLTQEEQDAHHTAQASVHPVAAPKVKAYNKPTATSKKMFEPEHQLVRNINAKKASWRAKVYPQWEKLTVEEFNRMAGFRPAAKKAARVIGNLPTETVLLQEDEIKDLPETWDWRNVDGVNYVDPVILQDCGSCFAVSTTSMIMSRIRIQTKNKEKPQIDYKQVLECDRYNQGCAGGYPFLVEKYTQDFGLTLTGKCALPSGASTGAEQMPEGDDDQALLQAKDGAGAHEAHIRIKEFGYIGGYYGNTRTAQMMHELHKNGPIVVGINGGYELMHYETGVFVQTGASEEPASGIRNDFEKVDHAVLVVGWGKDADGARHWIIKNSYGSDWGENGYFRIPLGGDVDGITSLTSSGIPVLGGSDYFNELEQQAAKDANVASVDAVVPEA